MEVYAFLQARYSSTRLPGKVMLPLMGKPMLLRQIERVSRAKNINKLVVLTSVDPSDDVIFDLCLHNKIDVFRGDLKNVLDRFYQAACFYQAPVIVRLTGDCPLIDSRVIDGVVGFYNINNYDYVSNVNPPTYPDGLDVEVFSSQSLCEAWNKAVLPSQQEHVTPFIHSQPNRFKIGNFCNQTNLSHLRWTVDDPSDFMFVKKVYEHLYDKNNNFSMEDIIQLLVKFPALEEINMGLERNEGYKKSLLEDFSFIKQERKNNV